MTELSEEATPIVVDRRRALAVGAAAAVAGAGSLIGLGGSAWAGDTDPHAGHGDHGEHHGHEGHGQVDSQHQALIDAAFACLARGEACVPHCVDLMAKGDTSLAECLKSVSAMMPICGATARFAALDAPRLKELAKLCSDVCADCEKLCLKHAEHHAVCKACAESCAAFIKEAKKLTG